MSQKDELRRMKVAVKFDYTSITNAAAFQTAHTTTCVDTQGYETNMYLLMLHAAAVTDNYVFTLYESDTSATDTPGTTMTACGTGDVIAVVDDNDATIKAKISAAGVLTTTAATTDNGHAYIFEYLGTKRWIKLYATVGAVTIPMTLFTIQMHPRHGPYYSP
jgi:hypothetical protein